jgi:alpha-glucosidase
MIGGGEWNSFKPGAKIDQNLFVRSAQLHALSPMMQFSASPWRVLDKERQEIVRNVVKLRQRFAPRFVELAKECGKTGEPMLRSLEYNYPNMGYATIKDQFMMGDFLLVAPQVQNKATERKVVIPPGRWKGDDGAVVVGPKEITVQTPLSRLVYFTKE